MASPINSPAIVVVAIPKPQKQAAAHNPAARRPIIGMRCRAIGISPLQAEVTFSAPSAGWIRAMSRASNAANRDDFHSTALVRPPHSSLPSGNRR